MVVETSLLETMPVVQVPGPVASLVVVLVVLELLAPAALLVVEVVLGALMAGLVNWLEAQDLDVVVVGQVEASPQVQLGSMAETAVEARITQLQRLRVGRLPRQVIQAIRRP